MISPGTCCGRFMCWKCLYDSMFRISVAAMFCTRIWETALLNNTVLCVPAWRNVNDYWFYPFSKDLSSLLSQKHVLSARLQTWKGSNNQRCICVGLSMGRSIYYGGVREGKCLSENKALPICFCCLFCRADSPASCKDIANFNWEEAIVVTEWSI